MLILICIIVAIALLVRNRLRRCPPDSKPLVQVVVLGDIGHSPRMQYHALSLVATGRVCVELIGFAISKPLSALSEHPDVKIRPIRQLRIPPTWKVPFVVYAILKTLYESIQLFLLLVTPAHRPDVILLQTPPAVPALAVCGLVSLTSSSHLIADFHNITWMHLGSKVKSPIILSAVRLYEQWMTRFFATSSFCVTDAMNAYLVKSLGISSPVKTLYDRPGPQFAGRTSVAAKSALEQRLIASGDLKRPFSEYAHILCSSTSWTPDENFSLLIDALPAFSSSLPPNDKALLFITGKGELCNDFITRFNSIALPNVELQTAWLAASDYPLLLGVADIGISLHTSTSGLDLPMKVVDMLGAELPVVALAFPAMSELPGPALFSTAAELTEALVGLTVGAGAKDKKAGMSKLASKFRQTTFLTQWNSVAWPVIERCLTKRSRQARRRCDSH